PASPVPAGRDLGSDCRVSLTVRVDLEDRNFHAETHRNGGAEHHFNAHTSVLLRRPGFEFKPAADRQLRVFSDAGVYHPQAEWSDDLLHAVEKSRGQVDRGDAYSPGWFELLLAKGQEVTLTVTADPADPEPDRVARFVAERQAANEAALRAAALPAEDKFGRELALAVQPFVV